MLAEEKVLHLGDELPEARPLTAGRGPLRQLGRERLLGAEDKLWRGRDGDGVAQMQLPDHPLLDEGADIAGALFWRAAGLIAGADDHGT